MSLRTARRFWSAGLLAALLVVALTAPFQAQWTCWGYSESARRTVPGQSL
jgi:hypothetical protein